MGVMNGMNREYGRGTLAFAAAGWRQTWKLKSEHRSARNTPSFDNFFTVSDPRVGGRP